MKNWDALRIVLVLAGAAFGAQAEEKPAPVDPAALKDIKAYCLDFNWELSTRVRVPFASPGTWAGADPAQHVAWYKAMGANVIQTFCVSANGYAWYKNGVVPEQPGLKHDFLREVVTLGHREGMAVMGYFCIGANSRWGKENPALSYGTPSRVHIPYTDEYLAYLAAAIGDAVKTTGIDGFMIDWVWQPNRDADDKKWIDSEKRLYQQLMGAPFPGEDKLSTQQEVAYSRKAIDRCWKTIHKVAKDANPKCIIWLTTNKMKHPHVNDSDLYREVDWMMGEAGRLEEIESVRPMVGKNARLITCFADWNGQDASKMVPEALAAGIGLYGFAKPQSAKGTVDLEKLFTRQLNELSGNNRNIAALARAYRGRSTDSKWSGADFVEPAVAAPFRISLSASNTAELTFEKDQAVITVKSSKQSGRAQLTRAGAKWPSRILVRVGRRNPETPGPTQFRIANGRIAVSIAQEGGAKVVAGEMQGGLDLRVPWDPKKFLNGGNPAAPIKLEGVEFRTTNEAVEIAVPANIVEGDPQAIAFEWGNGEKVR